MARKDVQLHSHDFEWEDLARACREQVERAEDATQETEGYDDNHQQQQLAQLAKDKWEIFHQLNNGALDPPVRRWW